MNVNTDPQGSPHNTAINDTDLNWYPLGRTYVAHLIAAAQAFHDSDHRSGSREEEAADHQLWPLDTVEAEDLRTFIAGIHREAQAQLSHLRDRDNYPKSTGSAPIHPASSLNLVDEPPAWETWGPQVAIMQALLHSTLGEITHPTTRTEAFGRLGISDYDIRRLISKVHDESPDHETLTRCAAKVEDALNTATASELRRFISGQRYAHGCDL